MTSLVLVIGSLGSGKTSFLKHVLTTGAQERRTAIIQNEFAPTGIDEKELLQTSKDFHLVELNNGSVFCVCLMSVFLNALHTIISKHNPELIFLEASGLADPVNVMELLQDQGISGKITHAHIITVVDAVHFEKGLNMLPGFRHQVMVADHLLLNKTDLFGGDLGRLRKQLTDLNPFAEITETTHCRVDPSLLLKTADHPHKAAARFKGKRSAGRPPVKVSVLRTHDKMTHNGLTAMVSALQKDCYRIKGFVNMTDGRVMGIHSVFETTDYQEISSYAGPTELVTFGLNTSPAMLRELFQKTRST